MDDIIRLFVNHYPQFIKGTGVTLNVTFVGLIIGMALGLPLAVIKIYGSKWISRLADGYIALFRGTPLMVQLFIIYYGLPDFHITLSQMAAAYISLGLNSAAYQAEYFRGSILSIGQGQMMAARAIGMSKLKAIFYIILPQALRLVIPSWTNEAIGMIRASSVIFLIAIPDVMGVGKILSGRYFTPLAAYIDVAIIYLIIILILGFILERLEKALKIPGLDVELHK
jgi:polar amino acid transport system permease protein